MKRRTTLFLIGILLLSTLFFSNGCNINQKERLIAKLGTTEMYGRKIQTQLGWYTISPDGRRIAREYVESKASIIIDGSKGKQYDRVGAFAFSPDSKRYAYVATKDKKYIVVVDGKEGKPYDYFPLGASPGEPYEKLIVFSPDSRHVAYSVRSGPKNFIVVKDGVEGKQYDWPETHYSPGPGSIQMAFSPDGKTLAYVAYLQIPGKNPGICQQVVVQNDVEGKQYGSISNLTFSADSRHLTYIVVNSDMIGNKMFLVTDGVEGKVYNSGQTNGIKFSPDGKRTAFLDGYGAVLYVDGVEIKKRVNMVLFSPDSQKIAYVRGIDWSTTYSGGANLVVFDGHEEGPYRSLYYNITFSPDSKRIAYAASASMDMYERKWVVVVDGKPGEPCNDIFELTFSMDSRHLAYKTYTGTDVPRYFVVSDGIEGPSYSNVTDIVFSSDGGRLAYIGYKANINQQFVVLNGGEGKYYDWVSKPAFSPDGKHLVYFAQERQDFFAVVDGVEMKHYKRILDYERNSANKPPPVIFDASSGFHYMVLFDGNIYLVTETLN